MGTLDRKTAIVTGAARGIGEATIHAFVEAGANCVAIDRDGDVLAASLAEAGHTDRVLALEADVSSKEDMTEFVAMTVDRFGSLQILVNNAGVGAYFDPVTATSEDWDSVISVDLKGPWICAAAAVPQMRASGSGSIVNVGSIHTRVTVPGMFPYAAAKSGVVGLTRGLALDLAPDNIRVNTVSPGWTRTQLVTEWFENQPDPVAAEASVLDIHPMGRICEPSEIAAVVRFLASDESSGITGAEIAVDAGLGARMPT